MTTMATTGAFGPVAGERRLSRDRRFRRVAWTRGSIAPYTSTWIVIQRFMVLNQPSPQSFEADFIRNDASGMAMSLDCSVRPERSLRLSRFCRVTGEDAGSLQGSQVGHYPESLWPLFGRFVVWCPACLAEGFHSVLFSLCGLQQCPVHNLPLEYRCRCGLTIPHGKLGSPFRSPGCCRCGRVFLEAAAARAPKPNPARDAVLGELADWLLGAGSRFCFDLREPWSIYPGIERYMAHARHWAQVLAVPTPQLAGTARVFPSFAAKVGRVRRMGSAEKRCACGMTFRKLRISKLPVRSSRRSSVICCGVCYTDRHGDGPTHSPGPRTKPGSFVICGRFRHRKMRGACCCGGSRAS
ncbi:hypothetical protein M0765_023635 [Variovorax sp. S2]|uniref:hypothetical protein n=1 Tax=Variovorax sp. S12S4 TaxID=3029170 RepID=UPI00215CB52A|nr:hypothetical protein [Variovorax sp. S12S4]MCR8960610.1 hypothetical protein [Variovorax sp. S12S4]